MPAWTPPALSRCRMSHQLLCLARLSWLTTMVLHGGGLPHPTLRPVQSSDVLISSFVMLVCHSRAFPFHSTIIFFVHVLPSSIVATIPSQPCVSPRRTTNCHHCACTTLRTEILSRWGASCQSWFYGSPNSAATHSWYLGHVALSR